jgi:CheY-like chemotaxis protein
MKPYVLIAQPNKQLALDYAAIVEELGLFPAIVPSAVQAVDLVEAFGAPALAILELSLPALDFLSLTWSLNESAGSTRVPVLTVGRSRDVASCTKTLRAELGIDVLLGHTAPLDSIRCAAESLLRAAQA